VGPRKKGRGHLEGGLKVRGQGVTPKMVVPGDNAEKERGGSKEKGLGLLGKGVLATVFTQ